MKEWVTYTTVTVRSEMQQKTGGECDVDYNKNKDKGVKRIAVGRFTRKFLKREAEHSPFVVPASMAVEAAFTIPIFVFAVSALISIIIIAGVQMRVRQVLYESIRSASSVPYTLGRDAGSLTAATVKGASFATVQGYFFRNIGKYSGTTKMIEGGGGGVRLSADLLNSETARIHISAGYKAKVPIAFFTGGSVNVTQNAEGYAWLGDDFMNAYTQEKMVYITPHGSVYHEDINCTYLKPRVSGVAYSSVSGLRNSGGEKYRECEACTLRAVVVPATVYVTSYGNRFHTNPNCVKIKHEVITVPLSQVGGRRKCAKEEGRGLIGAGG